MSHIFEIVMLVCFGAAWPFSIRHQFKTKKSHGKSIYFLCIILVGYLAGIGFKTTGTMDNVIWLYVLNFMLVSVDLALTVRYREPRFKGMTEIVPLELEDDDSAS